MTVVAGYQPKIKVFDFLTKKTSKQEHSSGCHRVAMVREKSWKSQGILKYKMSVAAQWMAINPRSKCLTSSLRRQVSRSIVVAAAGFMEKSGNLIQNEWLPWSAINPRSKCLISVLRRQVSRTTVVAAIELPLSEKSQGFLKFKMSKAAQSKAINPRSKC